MTIGLFILYTLSLFPALCKISIYGANINLFGMTAIAFLPFLGIRFLAEKSLITKLKHKKIITFLIIWLLIDFISVYRAISFKSWIKYNYFFIIGLALSILVAFCFTEKKHYYYFLCITNISFLLHNLIGWIEILTGKYFFLNSQEIEESYQLEHYPVSMFGNTNDMAIFLVIAIFLVLILNNIIKTKIIKTMNAFLIASSTILIYASHSRACWLALALGMLIYLFLNLRYTRKTYYVLFFFGFSVSIVVLFVVCYVLNSYQVTELNSIGMRINLIKNGFTLLLNSYGLGVGSGNIEVLMLETTMLPTAGMSNLHNWWIEVLVAFGVFIFFVYLYAYVKCLIYEYKRMMISDDKRMRRIHGLIFTLLIVFAIACISSSSINSYGWIWMLYGCIISIYYYGNNKCRRSE